jgi:hypothetical protein
VLALQPASFASNAAACAISLGLLERAVELLDHGQSVFWSQAMDTKMDLQDLRDVDSNLAAQFERLTCTLHASTFQDSLIGSQALEEQSSVIHQIEQCCCLTKEMESQLECIQKHLNLHNFMKPPPFSELQLSAVSGPVILINASSYWCDVLIVTAKSPPQLVPLPKISMDNASRIAKDFHGNQGSHNFCLCIEQHLPFIWHAVVQPVLLALGFTAVPASTCSKLWVWWCPIRPFLFIPIHTAGPYTKFGSPDLTK